ncbi:MAG: diguanylate cyclase [Pseudomonadota bacterium]
MSTNGNKEAPIDGHLHKRLVSVLYAQSLPAISGSLLLAAIDLAYYWSRLSVASLAGWLSLIGVGLGFRFVLFRARRANTDSLSTATWERLYAGSALIASMGWCFLTIVATTQLGLAGNHFANLSVAGLVGASVASLAGSRLAFLCFALPFVVSVPFAIRPSDFAEWCYLLLWFAYFGTLLKGSRGVHGALVTAERSRLENLRLARELEKLADRDPLTGLANRRALAEAFEEAWSGQLDGHAGIVLCDIDFFKQYNDALGHQAGDDCLRRLAELFQGVTHGRDALACRLGGEEFLILLRDTSPDDARAFAERVREAVGVLQLPHPRSQVQAHVTVSIGVATALPSPVNDPDALLGAADRALYAAKAAGRDRVVMSAETLSARKSLGGRTESA